MYTLIIVLIVISSILLTLLVLVQNSKGGGLAAGFSSSNQIMGVRKTTDFLEKATWFLVSLVVVLSILSVALPKEASAAKESDDIEVNYKEAKQPSNNVPATPFAAPQTAPTAPEKK